MRKKWNNWKRQNMPTKTAAEMTDGNKEQEQWSRRKHTTWGDIGIGEYSPKTTKWECRFEYGQREMVTESLTRYHRNKLHPEHSIGKQEIARPYCNKTYMAQDKLFTHVELAPQKGKRDMEIRPHLQTEGDPKENGPRCRWRRKVTCLNSDCNASNPPTDISH